MIDPRSDALIREATTTSALLAAGVEMLLRPSWSLASAGPSWTCLASGAERLLKLAVGLTAEANKQPWPTAEIRNVYGHRLGDLRPSVDQTLQARLIHATSEPYVRALAELVTADPLLADIFQCLSEWSEASGRYRDLDLIGGAEIIQDPPSAAWERAERKVWEQRPELLGALTGPDHRAAVETIRTELASSMVRWWFLHYRAWSHGVFGPKARHMSGELDPRSRPTQNEFARKILVNL